MVSPSSINTIPYILYQLNKLVAMAASKREIRTEVKQVCSEMFNEELINKVCNNFVKQYDSKIDKKLDKINDSIKALTNSVASNENSIKVLKVKNDFNELRAKRNSLRFHGFEDSDEEDVMDTMLSFINDKLNVKCSSAEVDSVFRVGKENPNGRVILVNFVTNWKRSEVFSAKKLLKNTGISVYEDLTKERYELLLAAKKKYGKSHVWSSGGKVHVLDNNKKIVINSVDEL